MGSNNKVNMKVCVVIPHFYPHVGGAEQGLMNLVLEYVKKGMKVRVITAKDDFEGDYQNYQGIDIYYYDWKMLFGHPLARKKDLKEHILWADVVHSLVYSVVPATSHLCIKYKKPHICMVHEVLRNKWFWVEKNIIKALIFRMYEKYIVMQKPDLFICPSTATLNDLRKTNKKCNAKRVFCISEFEIKDFKENKKKFYDYFGVTKDDRVFLNYGRPGKTKGLFVYLDAIKKIAKEMNKKDLKNIKFCFIMGNDPISERNRFLKEVKENNLENNVIVKESVSRNDLDNYRMCADYIVVPSITEGFGLTAIEACEFKKNVILSNGGSLPEVAYGSVLYFENRNSNDLADKLKSVILNKAKFENKEKKDFSKETISKEYIDIYKKVIKEKEKEK